MFEHAAFVYPGQRPLRPNEGAAWQQTASWGLVREAANRTGIDVQGILLAGSAAELADPRRCDLATFVLSMMAYDTIVRRGVQPLAHAGHGVGQYAALVAGGVLDYGDAVELVAERSEAIADVAQSAGGAMVVATGVTHDMVARACTEIGRRVWIASYNTASESVVAGAVDEVRAVSDLLAQLGGRTVPVPAGCPLHTPLMEPAIGRYRRVLGTVRFWDGATPVCADVTGSAQTTSVLWPGLLCKQLTNPVQWLRTMLELATLGATTLVECGPRPYLSRLASRSGLFPLTVHVGRPVAALAALGRPHRPDQAWGPAPTADLLGKMIVNTTSSVGVFVASPGFVPGALVEEGALVGHVGDVELRSMFSGRITLLCTLPGERIRPHERVAWIGPCQGGSSA